MPYRLELLGRVQLLSDGRLVESFAAHRQKLALLAYLALQPDLRATRDRLVGLFWPERDESSARHSLSELVYEIRREASDLVEATRASVGLVAGGFRCDALEFREAAESGDHERAVELYGGNLLEGLSLSVAPDFEHWAEAERSQLLRIHRRVCRERVAALRDRGEFEAAIASTRRWLEADPFEDEAHRALIELLHQSGDRSGALEQYERYAKLCREMEVEPLEDLETLVERIRSGDVAFVREVARNEAAYGGSAGTAVARALVFDRPPRDPRRLLRELLRRHVLEVAALYAGVAILAIKAASLFLDPGAWPAWALHVMYGVLAAGFPIAVGFAWSAGVAARAEAGGAVVLTPDRLPPGFRWLAAVRSQDVMALLGLLALGLVLLLLLVPPPGPIEEPGLDSRRVAVLHFDDLSEGHELGHLAAGFTQALINELGGIEALKVISYNGVKPFRDASLPVDSIAQRLDAGSLVEGALARSGDRLRVNVHLVDGASGVTLETRTVERPWGELFALQDDLVREVSSFLRGRLGVQIRLRERRSETRSVDAWELVRRAERVQEDYRPLRRAGDTQGALRVLEHADSLLREAEVRDAAWVEPTVLRGWVAETKASLLSGTPGQYRERFAREALAHAERALGRRSRDARALELRGTVRYGLSRQAADASEAARLLTAAERDLREAVTAEPSRATAWSALSKLLHVGKGEFAEAKRAALRAYEEDAFLADAREILFRLSNVSLELKEYDEAIRWAREGRRRWPNLPDFHALELGVLASGGVEPDIAGAWELVDSIGTLTSPQRRTVFLAIAELWTAAVLGHAGLSDSARAVIRRATARVPPAQLPWLAYDEAHAWLLAGDREQALRALRMHLESEPQRRAYIAQDPWFEPLRDDPGFRALVAVP